MLTHYLHNLLKQLNRSKILRYVFLVVGLAAVAFAVAHIIGSAKPAVNNTPSTPIVATQGNQGGHGGGKTSPITMPADWPASVPVPAYTLIGTNTSIHNSWTLQFLANTGYPEAMQTVENLYTSNGFTKSGNLAIYENANYKITVVGENRDHSATATNIVIQLQKL